MNNKILKTRTIFNAAWIAVIGAILVIIIGILNITIFKDSSKLETSNNKLSLDKSDFIVSDVIINLTQIELPVKDGTISSPAEMYKIAGKYRADVGILITSLYQCPQNAISLKEYEGTLPQFGIQPRAITYFLPELNTALCTKGETEIEYKLYSKWSRRSDIDWAIVVPGYNGSENADSRFKMYSFEINKKSLPDMEKADKLKSYSQNLIETKIYSLSNKPDFASPPSIKLAGKNKLKITFNFKFGNECSAGEMQMESRYWITSNNAVYLWAHPIRKTPDGPLGELRICPANYSPVNKKYYFTIDLPQKVSRATILIPNYQLTTLPYYIKKVGL